MNPDTLPDDPVKLKELDEAIKKKQAEQQNQTKGDGPAFVRLLRLEKEVRVIGEDVKKILKALGVE
jgi:hypothetical protein